jgi:hypothetical protein
MTELGHWQIYITWLITALAGAFGIGVGWTVLRESVRTQKNEFEKYTDNAAKEFINYKEATTLAATAATHAATTVAQSATTAMNERDAALKDRLTRIENKIDTQVGYGRCKDMRDECSSRIISQLAEISRQITANRDTVIGHMKETDKFIGRVEQFMKDNNGK